MKESRPQNQDQMATAAAWYRADQWDRLRSLAADPEVLEDTYRGWQSCADDSIRKLASTGVQVRKVDVDVEEMWEWCQSRGTTFDGKARALFAAEKLRSFVKKEGLPGS